MSIEQALADNTAALKENTAVLQATLKTLAGATTPAPAPAASAAPAAPKKAKAEKAAADTGPSAKTVADAIVDLANTVSRDAAKAVLKEFGAERASQIKPDDFAAVLARVAAVKAGGATPAAAPAEDSLV